MSDKKNYVALMKVAMHEVFKRTGCCNEDAEDIAAESLGNVLDYYQRKPEKLMELELKQYDAMLNYLKKAIKNHVINIIVRNYKQKTKENKFIEKMKKNDSDLLQATIQYPCQILNDVLFVNDIEDDDFMNNFKRKGCEDIQKDIFLFIEDKFEPEKWGKKKEAITLYMKRIETNKTIAQMQSSMPNKNLSSLNTQAHRIICAYRNWLKLKTRSERQ
jgi:hypothetical protein